jgi:HSP20 family protein
MTRPLLTPLTGELSEQLKERLRRLLTQCEELRAMEAQPGAWHPPIDLYEMKDAIMVRVEVPGVARERLRISLTDDVLKIEGRKERAPDPSEGAGRPMRYICLERSYGGFVRRIALKWPVDPERISAHLADGVLQIRLPKAQSCGREIVIPVSE